MSEHFERVKQYLLDLDIKVIEEDEAEELVVVDDPENGIQNLVIDCEDPLVILEQLIMETPKTEGNIFKRLLELNNDLVHGAFTLKEDGRLITWRDTLQIENLDLNELEGSIRALSLAMAEMSSELLKFAKQ